MSEGIDPKEWGKSQEKIFSADNVITDVLKNPIQRQRVDVAVSFVGGPNLRVLDVGAGDMSISQLIAANGNSVVGLDFGLVIKDSRGKGLDGVAGDASHLPFKDGIFDALFCGEIVEHQLDYKPFLQEIKRVLKTGGKAVLTTPNAVRLRNRLGMLFGDVTPWHEWNKVPHHVRYWTFDTLAQALEEQGFKVEEVGTGMSQGEGCIIEDEKSIQDYLQGQLSMEEIKILKGIIMKSVQHPMMLRSFVVMSAKKI